VDQSIFDGSSRLARRPVRVVGDPEEPLLEEALLDHGATALACARDHLLVGEHGLVGRAPVDRGLLLVRLPASNSLRKIHWVHL
jgi:hypothetical protein